MRKRSLLLIFCMFTSLTAFLQCETALASTMNSKAGITFSNSYIPNINTDSIIPDGSIVADNTSDDHINKKVLPKTGAYSTPMMQYLGLGSILIALVMLVTLVRNNNVENRNESFYLHKYN